MYPTCHQQINKSTNQRPRPKEKEKQKETKHKDQARSFLPIPTNQLIKNQVCQLPFFFLFLFFFLLYIFYLFRKNAEKFEIPLCRYMLYLCRVVLAGKYVYVEWKRIEFGFL